MTFAQCHPLVSFVPSSKLQEFVVGDFYSDQNRNFHLLKEEGTETASGPGGDCEEMRQRGRCVRTRMLSNGICIQAGENTFLL